MNDSNVRNTPCPKIDLGLAILECAAKPGEALTLHDIAPWCDCTHAAIARIERIALRKVANQLRFGSLKGIGEELFLKNPNETYRRHYVGTPSDLQAMPA